MGDSQVPGNYARPGDGSRRPGQPLVPAQFRPQEHDDLGAWGPPDPPRYGPAQPLRYVPPQYVPPQYVPPGQLPPRPQYPPPGYLPPQPRNPPAWYLPPEPQYPPPAPFRSDRSHTGRTVLAAVGALVVVIVGITVANSGQRLKTAGSTAAAAGGGATTTARVGSAITLAGNSGGEQTAVTVTKVIATAQPADQFNAAATGNRLYAVQFRLRDTGRTAYSDAPTNGATVVDSTGQSYDSSLDDAAGCPSFATPENITAGASGLGCVVFEVPKSATITQVQFTLDSGMGPDTGQWTVG